jgi:hypothetical protein
MHAYCPPVTLHVRSITHPEILKSLGTKNNMIRRRVMRTTLTPKAKSHLDINGQHCLMEGIFGVLACATAIPNFKGKLTGQSLIWSVIGKCDLNRC